MYGVILFFLAIIGNSILFKLGIIEKTSIMENVIFALLIGIFFRLSFLEDLIRKDD